MAGSQCGDPYCLAWAFLLSFCSTIGRSMAGVVAPHEAPPAAAVTAPPLPSTFTVKFRGQLSLELSRLGLLALLQLGATVPDFEGTVSPHCPASARLV